MAFRRLTAFSALWLVTTWSEARSTVTKCKASRTIPGAVRRASQRDEARVGRARSCGSDRRTEYRSRFRASSVVVALTSKPAIGLSGRHLALLACLVVFVVEMLGWPILPGGRAGARVGELAVLGASAVALVAFQPNGVSELAGGAVVFTAGVALSPAGR